MIMMNLHCWWYHASFLFNKKIYVGKDTEKMLLSFFLYAFLEGYNTTLYIYIMYPFINYKTIQWIPLDLNS